MLAVKLHGFLTCSSKRLDSWVPRGRSCSGSSGRSASSLLLFRDMLASLS